MVREYRLEGKIMYCRKCGKTIPDESKYCPYCRTAVNVENKKTTRKKKKRGVIIGITISLTVFALFLGALFWMNKDSVGKDIQSAIDSAWSETDTDDSPAFLQEITRISSYEITDIEQGEIYTVHVRVKGIDLGKQLKNVAFDEFPQEEDALNEYLIEIIQKCASVETEANIYVEMTEARNKVTFSDTFIDAMSGKIYSYYMGLIEDMVGE